MKEYLSQNPAIIYYVISGVLSLLIHMLAARSPRFVAFLQAVSLDLPKAYKAFTDKAPPGGDK